MTRSTQSATPLVSVVMPAFNCADHISESIDSVLSQDYPAIELVVVDDGSTDATAGILASYGERIRFIRQANSGAAVARNEGLRQARGEYIAFLDADDLWLPGKLRSQIAYLQGNPTVGTVFCGWLRWNPEPGGGYRRPELPQSDDDALSVVPHLSGWLYTELLLECVLLTSTVVMRRGVIEHVGRFRSELRRGQDYDYWLRASRVAPIHKLSANLALYRIEELPRKFPLCNWEHIVVEGALQHWGPRGPDGRELDPRRLRRRLWQLNFDFAYAQYHAGRFDAATEAFATAREHRPWHARSGAYAALSALRRRVNAPVEGRSKC